MQAKGLFSGTAKDPGHSSGHLIRMKNYSRTILEPVRKIRWKESND